MDRISSANAVVVDGKRVFTDAAGTKFTGVWCTGIQEEIATFIESQGLDLSATDNTQLAQAIASFVAGKLEDLAIADQLDGLATALLQKIIQDAWYSFFPGTTSNVDGTAGIRKFPRHPMSITSALVWCTGAAPSATRVIIYCNGEEVGAATIPKGSESATEAFSPAISVSSSDYLTVGLESTGAVDVGVRLDFNKSFPEET